jgi:hypothetical protein
MPESAASHACSQAPRPLCQSLLLLLRLRRAYKTTELHVLVLSLFKPERVRSVDKMLGPVMRVTHRSPSSIIEVDWIAGP